MDLIYERKQSLKVAFLRATFLFFISIFAFLITSEYRDYSILLAIFFLFLVFPTVTELKLFNNHAEIKIYYVLGVIHRKHIIKPEYHPSIFPFEIEVEANSDESPITWGTFLFRYYKINYIKKGMPKKFEVKLTEDEYRKIMTILN